MNSKERVIAALNRRPVDRIPLGLYAIDHDTIARVIGRPTYLRNKVETAIAFWENRRDEVVESMKADIVDLYRKLDCVDLLTFKETVVPPRGYQLEDPPRQVDETTWRDRRGNVYKISRSSNDVALVQSAAPQADSMSYTEEMFADRAEPQLPDKHCESRFEVLDCLIDNFRHDRYVATHAAGVTAVTMLGGFQDGLVLMALQPEVVHACNRQMVFRQNALDRYYIRAGADGVFMEQDFCGTNGPYISPTMFKQLAFPYLKQRIDHVKTFVPHVLFHSCGNTLPVMDMLIAAGIDAYESIQTQAAVSLRVLIERYGTRLTPWGAIPLEVLISGTAEDVRAAVRENIRVGREAPGFILGPSHSIAYGTRYENFMAMLDEFDRLR